MTSTMVTAQLHTVILGAVNRDVTLEPGKPSCRCHNPSRIACIRVPHILDIHDQLCAATIAPLFLANHAEAFFRSKWM